MLCVLIMAGGIGSRFWPQSTEEKPKQFLKLLDSETMIQMIYNRMKRIVPSQYIFVMTNERYIDLVKEQLPDIKDQNIICEPCSRNNGPSTLLSSLYIKKFYPNTNIAYVLSDSYIGKTDEFLKNIRIANNFVNENKEAIITIGITPTRPETEYGYIKYLKSNNIPNKVEEFIEKPNLELAKKYSDSHDYLWNSGILIYNNENMLREIMIHMPHEYNLLKDLPNIKSEEYSNYLKGNYIKCQNMSIYSGVMEKSPNTYVIPSDIEWDDVGSWHALKRYIKKDLNNNIVKGDVKTINSHDNIIYSNGKKIIFLNVDNLFCIDSDKVVIVGRKEDIDKVHLLKEEVDK